MRTASITLHLRIHCAIALLLACPCAVKLRRCMRATAACRRAALCCRQVVVLHILHSYQSYFGADAGRRLPAAKMIRSAFFD